MPSPHVTCPRCGYDLSGTPATWREVCPTTGRCAECGYDFQWHRVFTTAEHPWLFEYHWRRGPIRRFLLTILNAFRPRRFWRNVGLSDPVYLLPATIVAWMCAVLGFLVFALTIGVVEHRLAWSRAGRLSRRLEIIGDVLAAAPAAILNWLPGLVVAMLAMPVVFALIPATLSHARVKRSHIARIFIYSLVAPTCVAILWTGLYCGVHLAGFHDLEDWLDPREWARYPPISPSVARNLVIGLMPGLLLALACVTWMTMWWYRACCDYLQLDRPRTIVGVLALVLLLASIAAESVRWAPP